MYPVLRLVVGHYQPLADGQHIARCPNQAAFCSRDQKTLQNLFWCFTIDIWVVRKPACTVGCAL
jgi:hypothetical protein